MFIVFAGFAVFVKYGNPIWSVPLLFVGTVVIAAGLGDLVARSFSEPLNRMLRKSWRDGRRQLAGISIAKIGSAEL
jgi:hypothetical protein